MPVKSDYLINLNITEAYYLNEIMTSARDHGGFEFLSGCSFMKSGRKETRVLKILANYLCTYVAEIILTFKLVDEIFGRVIVNHLSVKEQCIPIVLLCFCCIRLSGF